MLLDIFCQLDHLFGISKLIYSSFYTSFFLFITVCFEIFLGGHVIDIYLLENCRSVYYAATDVVILRFMIEVCWAPMLAAFSVPLDQSDDEFTIALCLEGFRYAIHVTSVMSMKTHRDAFVTSLAKFTSLHSPADIKQKNIDAIKVGK